MRFHAWQLTVSPMIHIIFTIHIYGTRNNTLQRVFLSPDCSLWSEKYHCSRATINTAHSALFNPVINILCLYCTVNVTHYVTWSHLQLILKGYLWQLCTVHLMKGPSWDSIVNLVTWLDIQANMVQLSAQISNSPFLQSIQTNSVAHPQPPINGYGGCKVIEPCSWPPHTAGVKNKSGYICIHDVHGDMDIYPSA